MMASSRQFNDAVISPDTDTVTAAALLPEQTIFKDSTHERGK